MKRMVDLAILVSLLVILGGTGLALADGQKPTTIQNLVNVSWGDNIVTTVGDARLDTIPRIQRSTRLWKDAYDGDILLWRASGVLELSRYSVRRTTHSEEVRMIHAKMDDVLSQLNPVLTAREAARSNGQQFLIYLTVFDHGMPLPYKYMTTPFPYQDRWTIVNPYVQPMDREGNYHYGPLEFAYPEARQMMVNRLMNAVGEFDADGLFVCLRTHSQPAEHADRYGFSEPVAAEYLKRYGINILKDPRFDYKNLKFTSNDPAVENWRKLRGEYLVQYYRDLRKALPDKTIVTGIPRGRYLGPPYGNMYLDWETLVKERLVDGLIIGWYTGRWVQGLFKTPHSEIGYLSSEDDNIAIPPMKQAIEEIYGALCKEYGVKLYVREFNYSQEAKDRLLAPSNEWINGYVIEVPASGDGKSYIKHSDAMDFVDAQMTVEAFVYPRCWGLNKHQDNLAIPYAPRILSKYDNVVSGNRGWEWQLNAAGQLAFRVNQAKTGKDVSLTSRSSLPLDKWTHVATVYDGQAGEMRVFVDGKLDNSMKIECSAVHSNPNVDLWIGRYGSSGGTTAYNGLIDELRLSANAPVAVSVPKVPYTGHETGTVGLYHFDHYANRSFDGGRPGQSPVTVFVPGPALQVDSLPGFGKALNLRIEAPLVP